MVGRTLAFLGTLAVSVTLAAQPAPTPLNPAQLPGAVGTSLLAGELPVETSQFELLKYAVTQGGLFLLLLLLVWQYRRDFMRREESTKTQSDQLVSLVKDNTRALSENTEATKRVARAMESGRRPERADD